MDSVFYCAFIKCFIAFHSKAPGAVKHILFFLSFYTTFVTVFMPGLSVFLRLMMKKKIKMICIACQP